MAGTSKCSMTLLAIDGVYLTKARSITYMAMVQGQRATIHLFCADTGTFYLQTYADLQSRPAVGDTEARFNQNLLTLNVAANTDAVETNGSSTLDLS